MAIEKDTEEDRGIFDAFTYDDEEEETGNNSPNETGEERNEINENPFRENKDESIPPLSRETEAPKDFDTSPEITAPEPFIPPEDIPAKERAEALMGGGPRKLNKTLILSALFGVFTLFIIITFFVMPFFGKKNETRTKKPGISPVSAFDYASLVPRKQNEIIAEEPESDDALMNSLPPVDSVYQYQAPEPEKEPPPLTGSARVSERPDTKGDGLQTKTIRGIKGITSSQNAYMNSSDAPRGNADSPSRENPYARFGMPSKEEYTAQMLSHYGEGGSGISPSSAYASQNDQSGKMSFHNRGREDSGNGAWLGLTTVWQGTIFEAVLTSAINTDLPGEVTAMVAKNIYSSLDGRYLLIPQNSRLYGSYNSSISYSQKRVQVGWHTLIRPDGYAINLGNMTATDSRGTAGLPGRINHHLFQYIKAVALMSVFNIISNEFTAAGDSSNNPYIQNLLANSQNVTTTLGAKLIERAMDVQPTITIKAGLKINIVTNTHLALPPLSPYEVTMPYHR